LSDTPQYQYDSEFFDNLGRLLNHSVSGSATSPSLVAFALPLQGSCVKRYSGNDIQVRYCTVELKK
jgi:hypothetical protein